MAHSYENSFFWQLICSLDLKRIPFLPQNSGVLQVIFPKPSVNNHHSPAASCVVGEFFTSSLGKNTYTTTSLGGRNVLYFSLSAKKCHEKEFSFLVPPIMVSCVRVRRVYFMMHLKKMMILALFYKKYDFLSSIKIIETLDRPENVIIFLFFITFN